MSTHWLLQMATPLGQLTTQFPFTQFAEPPWAAVQTLPHVPQFALSFLRSTHALPQALKGESQVMPQLPPEQAG